MQRSEVSETALPQKARFRWVRDGRPSARTSVAVSERAQQNDYNNRQYLRLRCHKLVLLTRSNSLSPFAAFVR